MLAIPLGRAAYWLLGAALLCAPACTRHASTGLVDAVPQDGLLLTDANIIDPVAQEVREGNLLIRHGIIVATLDEVPRGFSGEIVDMDGKWVIPGLNDLHTHSFGNRAPNAPNDSPGTAVVAERMLYAGVTGFLDLFGDEDSLYAVRKKQRAGQIGGADIFASLSCLTATKGHCTEYGVPTRVMDSPEDARRVVADLAQRHPDAIKIVYQPSDDQPSIDKQTFAAAVATASARGIRTVVHIKTWQDLRDAVEVGASAVTHTPRGPMPDDLARLMAKNDVAIIPTLVVGTDLADFLFDREVLDNPMARALTTDAIIGGYHSEKTLRQYANRREIWKTREAEAFVAVKSMADAGVTILSGTDSGNWGTIQGYSLHRELMKLVAAGLTPWQALAASTTDAGAFLGHAYGVNPGDQANLVVLEASPIAEIRNTQRIALVIHHGEIVDREGLSIPTAAGSNPSAGH